MNAKYLRRILVVAVLGMCFSLAVRAHAQCCGGGYSAYYPSAYTAYSPVAYTSYYSGWYPGYYLDRIRARLWGSPSTYVASYPSYYTSSYAPSYSVGYRPAYTVGYAASYAAPACSSCSTCSSCPSYSVGYAAPCSTCAPACSSCQPCSGCSTCAAPAVSQAVYQPSASPGCASCGNQSAVAVPAPAATSAPAAGPTPMPQSTYGQQQQSGAPSLDPGASVPGERTQDTQRPPSNGEQQPVQPMPGSDTNGSDPYEVEGDSSTYFQAPKLFDPNDRTARRSIAPVTTAVYEKPVSFRQITTQRITRQQAESDAAGWISASK